MAGFIVVDIPTANSGSGTEADSEAMYRSIVLSFFPFRTYEHIASLFVGVARFVADTPERAQRVAAVVGSSFSERLLTLSRILQSFQISDSVSKVLSLLPTTKDSILVTPRTTCAVCREGKLRLRHSARRGRRDGRGLPAAFRRRRRARRRPP